MDQSTLRALALVSGLGFGIALPLGLTMLAGLWLDGYFGTPPLFLLIGMGLGLLLAGMTIAELLKYHRTGEGRGLGRRPDKHRRDK